MFQQKTFTPRAVAIAKMEKALAEMPMVELLLHFEHMRQISRKHEAAGNAEMTAKFADCCEKAMDEIFDRGFEQINVAVTLHLAQVDKEGESMGLANWLEACGIK